MTNRQSTLKFLTQGELKTLLIKAKQADLRDYAMILVAYRHGLRAPEVCNITVENIDLDGCSVIGDCAIIIATPSRLLNNGCFLRLRHSEDSVSATLA